MKYDPTSKKKLFIAIRQDSALRVLREYSLVIARKIGLPPSGSTMGNKALRIRNRLFTASTKMFLPAAPVEPFLNCNDVALIIDARYTILWSRSRGRRAQNDFSAQLAAAQRWDLRRGLRSAGGRIVLQMHAA